MCDSITSRGILVIRFDETDMTLNLYLDGDKYIKCVKTASAQYLLRRIMPLLFPSLYKTEEPNDNEETTRIHTCLS